jgi:DNA-binding NtrC family response regulator
LASDDERIVLDSREDLDLAMNRDYAIVLTGIRMPEKGMMRILRDIKRAKPAAPVEIITG